MTDHREFLYREMEAALSTATAASEDLLANGPDADNLYDIETALVRASEVLREVQALPRGPRRKVRA